MSLACIILILVLFYGIIIGFFAGVLGTKGDRQDYTLCNLEALNNKHILFKYANYFLIPCTLFASPIGFIGIPMIYFVFGIFFSFFGIDIFVNNIQYIILPYIIIYIIFLLVGYAIGCSVTNNVIDKLIKKYNYET